MANFEKYGDSITESGIAGRLFISLSIKSR
jgi:hypothetical protein